MLSVKSVIHVRVCHEQIQLKLIFIEQKNCSQPPPIPESCQLLAVFHVPFKHERKSVNIPYINVNRGFWHIAINSNILLLFKLWFSLFLSSVSFIFLCFKLVIIHYHNQKQRKIKFEQKKNSNGFTQF